MNEREKAALRERFARMDAPDVMVEIAVMVAGLNKFLFGNRGWGFVTKLYVALGTLSVVVACLALGIPFQGILGWVLRTCGGAFVP